MPGTNSPSPGAMLAAVPAQQVSGPVTGVTVVEDAAAFGLYGRAQLLGIATDADPAATLDLVFDTQSLPEGVAYNHTPGYTIAQRTVQTYYGGLTVLPEQIVAPVDTLSLDPTSAAYQSLAPGEERDVVVNYTITDGVNSAAAQAVFQMFGSYDAPAASGPVLAVAIEDGVAVTADGTSGTTAIDHGTVLRVVAAPPPPPEVNLSAAGINEAPPAPPPPILAFDPGTLPAGVTFDAATNSFTLDPANAAYQSLAAGQTQVVVVNYGVTDGTTVVAASTQFTVTGTNDAPVVAAPQAMDVLAGGAAFAFNPLANATDADQGTVLQVAGAVPSWMQQTATGFAFNPNDPAFQALAAGEVTTAVWNYGITDGLATVPATANFTVTGNNDAPVAPALIVAATEGGAGGRGRRPVRRE